MSEVSILTEEPLVVTAPEALVVPFPAPRVSIVSRLGEPLRAIAWAAVGMIVLVVSWHAVSLRVAELPAPADALSALGRLLANPFQDTGPNGKGIGLQVFTSLRRVFTGFGLAALVGVPLGLFIGANKRASSAFNPIVQILRPVSPLAWFPIWLVVFKDANRSAVFVIFITALWPTVLNAAAGATSVPRDHRNVARVFRFGRLAYLRHILVPDALPSIVTGLRLSMGIAWMVIVAVEMLSGGTGIGFFVWDAYNAGDLGLVVAAILLIGSIGLVLDALFVRLFKAVALEGADHA